ncbi:MAG: gamma-glutamylcyclotransferase [Bacteroidetes bacterium]|jgi:Uncharacterized conserved protein|uniref:gamma-glutamylcyclotransferase family protein n=1 Tax=Phnomibacter sp. TaxID=2836217 RepID=UPI002FDD6E76|nr:gamma-glutamylcyclotransferase [Bacteroidota bacterium]
MSKPETCFQLFVYGSLRKGFNSPAYEWMSRYFNWERAGKINGKLYDLGEYPAALPCQEEAYIVGELYSIKNVDEFGYAMAQLDDYEGIHDNEDDGGPLYRRDLVTVYLEGGQTTNAWVYWYARSIEGKPIIPSGDVLQYQQEKHR